MTTNQSPMRSLPPITLASIASAVIMYPVDVSRALAMSSATGKKETLGSFIKAHGVGGLVRQGVGPEVGRATIMRIMKFFNYPIVHRMLFQGKDPSKGNTFSRAVSGAIATIPEVILITPIELAK